MKSALQKSARSTVSSKREEERKREREERGREKERKREREKKRKREREKERKREREKERKGEREKGRKRERGREREGVPVIGSIVIVIILLLDLVDWHSAISSKMPCTIALVANWSFAFLRCSSFPFPFPVCP